MTQEERFTLKRLALVLWVCCLIPCFADLFGCAWIDVALAVLSTVCLNGAYQELNDKNETR